MNKVIKYYFIINKTFKILLLIIKYDMSRNK
uniref:Uncharacterized protein n=1 Tax=viral metagenome TaxID=1070528 RepID=A0A6C0H917_9ZZZZ